jgi:hypothetical protein
MTGKRKIPPAADGVSGADVHLTFTPAKAGAMWAAIDVRVEKEESAR